MANKQIFNNTLIITGSVTASQGFYGDGSNVTGVISSSYATTSSYAHFAVSSSHEITFEISSSHALRADEADSIAFDNITDKPTLISSSLQFDDLTSPFTGSFTGSFVGDGSGLTGISSGSIETGSLATTGSNTFIGDQTINGDLSFSGSYAQPTEYRLDVVGSTFHLNRSGSLGGGQNTYQTEIHHNGSKTQFKSDGSVRMELNGNVFQVQGDIDVTIGNQVTNAISASYFSGSFVGDGSGLTGVVKGTGTTNFFPIWSDGSNKILQDSQLQQSNINGSGTYVWTFNNTDRVIIDKPSSITGGDPEYLITQDGDYKFSMGWDDDGEGFGYFYNWTGNGIRLGAQGANPVLEILTDNTDPRVYINGKAGIGTNQPNNELTVKGIANITGSLEVTGSVILDTEDSTATALSIKNGLVVLDLTNLPDVTTISTPEFNQLPLGTLLKNGNTLYIKDQNF
jgi:hypothetical protein